MAAHQHHRQRVNRRGGLAAAWLVGTVVTGGSVFFGAAASLGACVLLLTVLGIQRLSATRSARRDERWDAFEREFWNYVERTRRPRRRG
jgi:hypothetical protein